MDRAATNKEPHIYTTAINGSRPDDKGDNIIWGWHRISKTMQSTPLFAEPAKPADPPAGAAADVVAKHQADMAKYQEDYAGHKAFLKLFHQARYNVAWCAYQQAMAQQTKDERDKFLKQADYALTITNQYSPDMGGEEWKPKYDELKKKVESAMKG
jgi:hypothetical protein